MKKMKISHNIIKYLIGLFTVICFRLLPHPPNVEPIMSTMMPFSKKWGWLSGLLFCLLAVLSFDLLTGTLGLWSLFTAGTYALLGALSGLYFKNKKNNIKNYVIFSIIATLIYDAITGVGLGVLFFNQPFLLSLTGQIPFTLYHLGGNIILAIIFSPVLYHWVIENKQLETSHIINRITLMLR